MTHSRNRVLILLGFGLTACSAGERSETDVPLWTLEEVVRIGSRDGGETALTFVSDVHFTNEAIYVLEMQPARIVEFDRSGQWIRTFGRSGPGPGEFVGPWSLGTHGSTLWVGDPRGARMELFSMDGEFQRSIRFQIPPDSLGERAFPRALLSNGTVLAGPGGISISGINMGWVDHLSFLQTDSSGVVLQHLVDLPVSRSDFFRGSMGGDRFIEGFHPVPEGPTYAVFPEGTGMVVVERWASSQPDSSSYTLSVYGADGEVRARTVVPYSPQPLGDHWLRRSFEGQLDRSGESLTEADRNQVLSAFLEGAAEHAFFPPVTRVVAGQDGSVWVRREETLTDSVRWDVLDRDAVRVGRLNVPNGLQIRAATLEEVWGVILDEMDVPYVVGFRVGQLR